MTQGVRRSKRLKERQLQANITEEISEVDPTTYEEAISSNHKDEWEEAMREEISSLHLHNVWKLIPRQPGMKVLRNKWIYTTKRNADNSIDRRKARLVVMECNKSRAEINRNRFIQ